MAEHEGIHKRPLDPVVENRLPVCQWCPRQRETVCCCTIPLPGHLQLDTTRDTSRHLQLDTSRSTGQGLLRSLQGVGAGVPTMYTPGTTPTHPWYHPYTPGYPPCPQCSCRLGTRCCPLCTGVPEASWGSVSSRPGAARLPSV